MDISFHQNIIQKLISAYVVLALLLSIVAPLFLYAEDTETPAEAPAAAEIVEEEPEEVEATVDEVSEESVEVEDVQEETVEETGTTETQSSESTQENEGSSASTEESGSESSEHSESSETTTESEYTESTQESESSETTEEYELETTTTVPESTQTVSENTAASTTDTTILDETAASTASSTEETVTNTGTTTSATTALATTTDTTSSTTPGVGVSTFTDGDTTLGTTTTVINPTATTSSSTATTTIDTGAAVATANVLNVVNSNLVNSDGAIIFYDSKSSVNETIDVRNQLEDPATSTCSLLGCAANTTNVQLDNNATIDNALILTADTGGNLITDAETGEITTGDAYANANIINVANVNLIDSQYLLMTLNAFGDFNGNLVLPALAPFLNNAATTPALSLDNTVQILNEVVTTAVTGENSTEAAEAAITSGDATTGVSLYNNINTNLVNDNVRVLFNVHGDWNGVVFGLPENVSWYSTGQGHVLEVKGASSTDVQSGVTSVNATNTAVINNRINVAANTGGNEITNADSALISTGNAFAGANIVNVANANIVGQNWMLAIVNVFGDFNGDVSFGRPDVWVGGAAAVPSKVKKDSEVTYTYTITNNGDAPANNIVVTDTVSQHVAPTAIGSSGVHTPEQRHITWNVDSLAPKESTTVSYTALVTTADEDVEITNTIEAALTEHDDNYSNNSEVVTYYTYKKRSPNYISSFTSFGEVDDEKLQEESEEQPVAPLSALTLQRSPIVSTVTAEQGSAPQTLKIINTSQHPIKNVLFIDQLYDVRNALIHEERFQLGTILPYEEITLSYTLWFNHTPQEALQIYSFDSVFYNNSAPFVLERNGYVNHLGDASALTTETPTATSFTGEYDITTGTTTIGRVLSATTSSSTLAANINMDWLEPLVPFVAGTDGDGGSTNGSGLALSWSDLFFPILLLLLALTYLYLRYQTKVQTGWEKVRQLIEQALARLPRTTLW